MNDNPPSELLVFGFAGQSNMAGPVPAMPNDIKTRHPGSVFLFTFANTWVDGFEPSHTTERRYGGSAYPDTWKDDFRSGLSPCLAFADKWVDLNPGAHVGIVPLGCTGRRLRAFMPALRENSLFVASTKRLRLACGRNRLGGMIFSQGEADTRALDDAMSWGRRFTTMVERWRADFGADLPVCLVKLGLSPQRPDLPYWDLVREQQENAAASLPNVVIVRTDALEKRDDRVHFVEAAYVETGETIALALNGADRPKPAAQSLPDMLTRRLHRAARSPRMLENTLADIEGEYADAGHLDSLVHYLLAKDAPTFSRLGLAARAGTIAKRAVRFDDFCARARAVAAAPNFRCFEFLKRLPISLGPDCDGALLRALFGVKYAGLNEPSSIERLFENARALSSHVEIPTPVLDVMFENSRYSAMGRAAWESDVKTAFAIQHLMLDIGLSLDQSALLMDQAKFAETVHSLKAVGSGIVILVHAGFCDSSATVDLIDREISNGTYLGGGYDRSPPKWIPLHLDQRAALFAALKALHQKRLLFMTPDGQMGRLTNTIHVLGKPLLMGDGTAFLAYESGCPTVFLMVRRDEHHLTPSLVQGPQREIGEKFPDFRARLHSFYEAHVNDYFSGHPKDLCFAMRWPKVFLDRQAE